MLEVVKLYKTYDHSTHAVEELSFSVGEGSILVLLGHNGAGKTTTLKIVSTMLIPSAGRVIVDGTDVFQADPEELRHIKRGIGFVPESLNVLDYLTAWEYIFYVGRMYGFEDDDRLITKVDELVDQFGITRARDKVVCDYSSGLRKRITIASALVNSPRLLLLDEPTANLDPLGVKTLKECLKEICSSGSSVILATHQLSIAEQLADDILIVNEGQRVFYGTPDDFGEKGRTSDGKRDLELFYSRLIAE
jgi:ABC-2 type transport system ATP-binding protein